jgi:uncharacterized protein YbjQ (UPF0145 family)
MGAINKRMGREIRMDAMQRLADTAGMNPRHERIEELLAKARDIAMRTMGEAHPKIVEAVFQQLCFCEEPVPAPGWENGPPH